MTSADKQCSKNSSQLAFITFIQKQKWYITFQVVIKVSHFHLQYKKSWVSRSFVSCLPQPRWGSSRDISVFPSLTWAMALKCCWWSQFAFRWGAAESVMHEQCLTGPSAALQSACTHFLTEWLRAHIQIKNTLTGKAPLGQHWHPWITAVVCPLTIREPPKGRWWRGWRCWWRWSGAVWSQDGARSGAVGPGPRFRGVGEGKGRGVDDSIVAH